MKRASKILLLFFVLNNLGFSQTSVAYDKGKNDFLTGNYPSAIENLTAAKTNSSVSDIDYLIALSYFNLKKYSEAIPFFSSDIKTNTNNLNSYLQRSHSHKKVGNLRSALSDLEEIVKINKDYFLAYYEIGEINYEQKNYKAAITQFQKTLAIRPNYEKAFYRMGFCYLNLKDTNEACKYWKKIEDLDDFEDYEQVETILKNQTNK